MYFNERGLVTDDQGDQFLYIPWKHVRGVYDWMMDGNDFRYYPGQIFTREQIAAILINFADETE